MNSYPRPAPGPSLDWPPLGAELVYEFVVLGSPKTAGSKKAFIPRRKDGSYVTRPNGNPMVVVTDDAGKPGESWRQDVGSVALGVRHSELLDGPLVLEVVFYLARKKGHFGTGKNSNLLKASAPRYPTTKPDALKLARAVEDALTSVLWVDDARIVDGRQRKEFGSPERAEVRVWRLPETVGEVATVTAEQGSLLDL